MTQNNNHKKLIVFDFNLDWKQKNEQDESNKDLLISLELMKKANNFQTIVLTTSGCFFDAIDFLYKKGINSGFLVASGGAIIYDIKNQKIISEHFLDKQDVKTLFHHGLTAGLNIIITTKTQKYAFISNEVVFNKLQKNAYSSFTTIKNINELHEILENESILDISYLSPYKSGVDVVDSLQLYYLARYYDNEQKNFIVKVNKTSQFIHIGSLHSTKLQAIEHIMNYVEVDTPNDVLYLACTCCNKECYIAFKNSLIASNVNFILELGNNKKHHFINDEIEKLDDKFGLESDTFWKKLV